MAKFEINNVLINYKDNCLPTLNKIAIIWTMVEHQTEALLCPISSSIT